MFITGKRRMSQELAFITMQQVIKNVSDKQVFKKKKKKKQAGA